MINKNDVFNMLQSVGIKSDDKVTIHCSLKAIGEIEGGADGLIDAFCEYLSEGLFIVPTHTWDNVGPDQPVYDVRKTVPCIGTLANVAAFRKDGIRSLHPTHEKGGAVVYGQLGDALVYCCDARKMTDIAENIWKNHGDELLFEEEW